MAGPYPPGHCNLVLAEDQKCCRCGCGYVFAPAAVTRIRFNHNMSTNHGGTTVYRRHLLPARELRDLRARARGASPKNSKICKMQRKKEKKKPKRCLAAAAACTCASTPQSYTRLLKTSTSKALRNGQLFLTICHMLDSPHLRFQRPWTESIMPLRYC